MFENKTIFDFQEYYDLCKEKGGKTVIKEEKGEFVQYRGARGVSIWV